MTDKLFWLTATIFLTAAVHLSYILFVPFLEMEQLLNAVESKAGKNHLAVLTPEDKRKILKLSDPQLVSAVCLINLKSGPVFVNAKVPATYWSMNVYTVRGDSVFTLNDRQAGTDNITVKIVEAKEQDQASLLPGAGQSDTATKEVKVDNSTALVVIRSLVRHATALASATEALGQSTCGNAAPG